MRRAPLLLLLAALAGCATPVAPTGGPADTIAPRLVRSTPETGATRVADPTLTLAFSERLNPASAARAVTVSPKPATPPVVSVRGADLQIVLPGLRDSTTYVVTIGTELSDARQVRLASPITLAFGTGDAIDRAKIGGFVRTPDTRKGVGGLAVFAFHLARWQASSAALDEADYQTESRADGAFEFEYVRPGAYMVVAIEDRNRNAVVDEGERFALPQVQASVADTSAANSNAAQLFVARSDTTAPTPSRVRELSDRRVAVRFTEPIAIRQPWDPRAAPPWIRLADSLSGANVPVRAYLDSAFPDDIFLVADTPLAQTPYNIFVRSDSALADSAGNAVRTFARSFRAASRADTVQARFRGFVGETAPDGAQRLSPAERPTLRFSSAPPDSALNQIRLVIDGAEIPRPDLRTAEGRSIEVLVPLDTPNGVDFQVMFSTADSTLSQRFRRANPEDLGAIVGTFPAELGGVAVVEVRDANGRVDTTRASADGSFAVVGLAPGLYRVRFWADANGNERWDGGAIQPFETPEPLRFLTEPIEVRAKWESEIETSDLRFDSEQGPDAQGENAE